MDHWHPVLRSAKLKDKPVEVRLAGREIVIFRTASKGVAALDGICSHRRMRLAIGCVEGDRLRCAYHGWTYDGQGHGLSPSTPKLRTRTTHYDTHEAYGAIWIRSPDSDAAMPDFDVGEHHYICTLRHKMNVPLELVVDNFTEVEHTPTTHALLGYELKNMAQVVTEVESTDSAVRVYNSGPQKRISPLVSMAFGISSGDRFVDDWTTRFSPVHSVYEQYWCDARTDVQKGVRWRNYVFFNPLSDDETELITFGFIDRGTFSGRFGLLNLLRPLMTWFVDREIRLDVAMVENLADKRPDIDGMKLSRFDRVLGLHRERINRIYRGEPAATNGA